MKKSIDQLIDIVQQCTQCDSQGEIMIDQDRMKTLKTEQHILTVKHIRKLESEIENLMKQKAMLQDQVDKYVDKEVKNDR